MGEKKTYPPVYIEPGDTVTISGPTDEIDVIGVWPEPLVEFVTAFFQWQKLIDEQPQYRHTIDYMQRKTLRLFNDIPMSLKQKILERDSGQIWLPEGGENATG